MTLDVLIDDPSNAGGVAARAGFTYQDQVGVGFLLDMLEDATIVAVEFETADDITLRILEEDRSINEYVQVKTTEDDRKWSIKEITERSKSSTKTLPGTSLCEKSLACDRFEAEPRFRIVSRRDVASALKPFCAPRGRRKAVTEKLAALKESFSNKHKSFTSKNKRNLGHWAETLYWQVAGSSDGLERDGINKILRMCEAQGSIPGITRAEAMYKELLSQVREASEADRATDGDKKSLARATVQQWWKEKLADIRANARLDLKVYTTLPEPFLKEIAKLDEVAIARSMRSFDVEFDDGEWRSEALCDYLVDWLPEIALPSHTLAQFDRFSARQLLPRALDALKGRRIDVDTLLAEVLLHAVMRNHLNSEPMPCRLFNMEDGTATSAHIVFNDSGDQLWLGRPHLLRADQRDDILTEIAEGLHEAVSSGVLKAERRFIMTLREPHHARPSSIDGLFTDRAKIEDLRRAVRLPILLAYESPHLATGFYNAYLSDLISEANMEYEKLKPVLPATLVSISVHIFLIPIPNVDSLLSEFEKVIKR
ncbi:dsDNA nuclease domain-containing protein [Paracoccus angustae]|uniref:DsDNA nuclease domain-containing protein n=1 Tax=Paracoccus angustae TaxID=1671480 RepID=A0ABV7U3P1_9RHOB